ncbi:MAG TPA: hypothetical protein VFB32_15820 [Rudaea sp.]|nr:hypothetical protein [Rudaea sp.]
MAMALFVWTLGIAALLLVLAYSVILACMLVAKRRMASALARRNVAAPARLAPILDLRYRSP